MSDAAVRPAPTGAEPRSVERSPRARAWDRARFVVIAGWLAVLIALPLTAEKSSSWSHLRDQVAAGKVTSVEVNGEMPAGADGFSTVQIRWKHGVLRYVTYVRQFQGHQDDSVWSDDEVSASLHTAPGARLRALQPGLSISRSSHATYSGDRFLGFEASGWLWAASAVLMLATLVLLVKGPPVWWATRWGWVWLMSSPIGTAAFLLLSGPFPGLPKPRNPDRRLTGGWAFLLSVVVKAVSITLWGFTVKS